MKWLVFLSDSNDIAQNKIILELSKRITMLSSPLNKMTPTLAQTMSLLLSFC